MAIKIKQRVLAYASGIVVVGSMFVIAMQCYIARQIDASPGADVSAVVSWQQPNDDHKQEVPKYSVGGQESANKQKIPMEADRKIGEASKPRCCLVYSKNYLISLMGLERLHPFDIHKYKKIRDQLVQDKLVTDSQLFCPDQIAEEDILLVQKQQLLDSLSDKEKLVTYLEAGQLQLLPIGTIKNGVLRPFRYCTGGTLLASRLALKTGIGINIGGGYHHAKPTKGEGFCIYADIPIAIRKLQKEGLIKRALVIDVDVHQGNGTAVCLADDDDTFTFSMHQGDIYPEPKEKSDWDIELDAGLKDDEYLKMLGDALPKLFEKSKPDVVFVAGGCDTLAGDPLAGLEMTNEGIVKRDELIVKAAVERNVPIVLTLSGGYSEQAWKSQYLSIRNLIETYRLGNASK